MNIFEDKNLLTIPSLLVYEKGSLEMDNLVENLRSKMNKIENLAYNIQYVSSKNEMQNVNLGFDWLIKVMKPI